MRQVEEERYTILWISRVSERYLATVWGERYMEGVPGSKTVRSLIAGKIRALEFILPAIRDILKIVCLTAVLQALVMEVSVPLEIIRYMTAILLNVNHKKEEAYQRLPLTFCG